jgi:hypothetical protein
VPNPNLCRYSPSWILEVNRQYVRTTKLQRYSLMVIDLWIQHSEVLDTIVPCLLNSS